MSESESGRVTGQRYTFYFSQTTGLRRSEWRVVSAYFFQIICTFSVSLHMIISIVLFTKITNNFLNFDFCKDIKGSEERLKGGET